MLDSLHDEFSPGRRRQLWQNYELVFAVLVDLGHLLEGALRLSEILFSFTVGLVNGDL